MLFDGCRIVVMEVGIKEDGLLLTVEVRWCGEEKRHLESSVRGTR